MYKLSSIKLAAIKLGHVGQTLVTQFSKYEVILKLFHKVGNFNCKIMSTLFKRLNNGFLNIIIFREQRKSSKLVFHSSILY